MAPRAYKQKKRAEDAQETRQKIIEATFALHGEKGVLSTSIKDIANRADVGIGTVYYHFPSYEEVVKACGVYTFQLVNPPTPAIFKGLNNLEDRVTCLVTEFFAFYERFPSLYFVRAERNKMVVLDEGLKAFEQDLKNTALALFNRSENQQKEQYALTILALTDIGVYHSLNSNGYSREEAATRISQVIISWLRTLAVI